MHHVKKYFPLQISNLSAINLLEDFEFWFSREGTIIFFSKLVNFQLSYDLYLLLFSSTSISAEIYILVFLLAAPFCFLVVSYPCGCQVVWPLRDSHFSELLGVVSFFPYWDTDNPTALHDS